MLFRSCYVNKEWSSTVKIGDLHVMDKNSILIKIGNKEDAQYVGGFNIFGKKFGDYEQDIIMSITYSEIV